MNQMRGVLFLADPLESAVPQQKHIANTTVKTLIFDESGRYLSLAQTALWKMRLKCGWVCVAAEGNAAAVALALAAQLPVDRLVLRRSGVFLPRKDGMPRELVRLEKYARRNLSLVVSELLLLDAQEEEIQGLLRGMERRVCALESSGWEECLQLLIEPWKRVCEKNLLIP